MKTESLESKFESPGRCGAIVLWAWASTWASRLTRACLQILVVVARTDTNAFKVFSFAFQYTFGVLGVIVSL